MNFTVLAQTAVALTMLVVPAINQAEQKALETKRRCLGVVVEGKDGPLALLGLVAEGDETAIDKFIAAARAIGVDGPQKSGSGADWIARVAFSSPPVTGSKATDLIERARSGYFGPLMITPITMGIQVLSREKCPEAYL